MANRIVTGSGLQIRPALEAGFVVLGYNIVNDRNDAILFAGDLDNALSFINEKMSEHEVACTCGKGG